MISPIFKLLNGTWPTITPSFWRRFGDILLLVIIKVELRLSRGGVCAYMKAGVRVNDTSTNTTKLNDSNGENASTIN
jgi:hypothetical protein